ncbi:MAG: DNA-directed RNA polymerase subunit D [Candidatus Diapherotrites archaeon]
MEVKVVSDKGAMLKFSVKGTDSAFANALRRTVMNNVPVFAIEDVSFYENSGVVFDEMLAHRLALLPIKMDLKHYKEGESVTMMLEKEGPGMVYSKDVKSTDPKIEVIDKRIPLTKLKKGQKLKIEMKAVAGVGKEHAKWQPAIIAYEQHGEDAFTFMMESHGNLDNGETVKAAVERLREKTAEFKKALKDI